MDSFKVLITTSDYLPNLGGLTSYTCNVESSLRELGISYELFHWRGKIKRVLISQNSLSFLMFITWEVI